MLKLKIISFLVAVTVLCSSISSMAFSDVDVYSDGYEAIATMTQLNIMNGFEDGTFKGDNTVSRGEFCFFICRIAGYEVAVNNDVSFPFSDVPKDYWARGYIKTAIDLGLISGINNNEFKPNEAISFEQALKVLVTLLGYEKKAEAIGGFPTGYLAVALQEGITKGVKNTKELSRLTCAKMLYNALEIPIMKRDGYGNKEVYNKSDNVLLDNLQLKKIEGVVIANKYSYSNSTMAEDEVKIIYSFNDYSSTGKKTRYNDITDVFKVNNQQLKDMLGKRIIAFVSNFTTDNMQIALYLESSKNSILKIKSEKDGFVSYDMATSKLKYIVKDKDGTEKEQEVEMEYNATRYVNGVIKANGSTVLMPTDFTDDFSVQYMEYGYYNLIDNDADGIYDVVLIDKYRDYYAGTVLASEDRIDDKLWSESLYFERGNINKGLYIIKPDGNYGTIEHIEKNDILAVQATEMDGYTILKGRVNIVRSTVTGKVAELSGDTSSGDVIINGVKYDYKNTNPSKKEVDIIKYYVPVNGDEGIFYLNKTNTLIYKDTRSSLSTDYAILSKIGSTNGISDKLELKLFDSNGKWNVYEFADNVEIKDEANVDNSKNMKLADLKKYLLNGADKKIFNCLITYKKNQQGKISTISFALNKPGENPDKVHFSVLREFNRPTQYAGTYYEETFNKLTGEMGDTYIRDNAVIFDINYSDTSTVSPDTTTYELSDDDVKVISVETLKNWQKYWLKTYDLDDGNEVKAVVGYNLSNKIDSLSNTAIISSISTKLNNDGETHTNITCYYKGEIISLELDDGYSLSFNNNCPVKGDTVLKIGDVINFAKNATGKTDKVEIIFRTEGVYNWTGSDLESNITKVNYFSDSANTSDSIGYYFGLVTQRYTGDFGIKVTLYANDLKDNAGAGNDYVKRKNLISVLRLANDCGVYKFEKLDGKYKLTKGVPVDMVADLARSATSSESIIDGCIMFAKVVGGFVKEVVIVPPVQ